MRILLYGATGMVGQGVLRECLAAEDVEQVVAIGRSAVEATHPKLKQVVRRDLFDYNGAENGLTGFDACFFCLGVSSVGMSEADYTRVTYDLTMAAATTLAKLNPGMVFVYVSGAGTDAQGRSMWARVKGRTEADLGKLDLKAYAFRPGFIQPLDGIKSKTKLYQGFLTVLGPALGGLRRLFPEGITTTREVGQAMLRVARSGWPTRVLEQKDIIEAGASPTPPSPPTSAARQG